MPCSCMKCQCGKRYIPQRYVMVILMCIAFNILFAQNGSFSLVLRFLSVLPNSSLIPTCGDIQPVHDDKVEEWDRLTQGLLASSYFIGFVLMLLPGGYLSDKKGGRLVCIIAVTVSSAVTLLFPLIVKYTYFWLACVGRACIGGATACIITAAASLISRWIPKTEWSTVGGAVFASGTMWIILHGTLLHDMEEAGVEWEIIFYIGGGVGTIWVICALLWLYSEPTVHPSLTQREKVYLEEEVKKRNAQLPLDWMKIMCDHAVWGLAAGQVGHCYVLFALITNMPSYFVDVLNANPSRYVMYLMIPNFFVWVVAILTGLLADYFIHRKGWKPAKIRKIYYSFATIVPAMFVVGIPFMKCDSSAVILLAAFGIVLLGPFFCSLRVNVLDITYNYSGFVTGVVCLCGAFATSLKPYIVEKIITDNSFREWKTVSYVIGANAFLNTAFYILFGSSKRRLWDMTPEERQFYRDQKAKEAEARKAGQPSGK